MANPRYQLRSKAIAPGGQRSEDPDPEVVLFREEEESASRCPESPGMGETGEPETPARDVAGESNSTPVPEGGDEGVGVASQRVPLRIINKENIPEVEMTGSKKSLDIADAWINVPVKHSGKGKTTVKRGVRQNRPGSPLNTANRFAELEAIGHEDQTFADANERLTGDQETPEVNVQTASGPSKGKGPDPANWGGLNLAEREMNLEAQAAELRHYAAEGNKSAKGPKKRCRHKRVHYAVQGSEASQSDVGTNVRKKQQAKGDSSSRTRPYRQIPKDSYLSDTFEQARKIMKKKDSPSSDDESDSSDDSSDKGGNGPDDPDDEDPSSGSSSDSDESTDSESSNDRKRDKKSKKSKKSKKGRRKQSSKSKSRAIKPKEYNGKENSKAFHRFMKEGLNYLEDAQIERKRYIYVLSHFLTGRAYDFYTQKVSKTEKKWSVEQFFRELFNYCFLSNYRMKMRAKLEKLTQQHNQSVIEYVYELEELFGTIGGMSERDKVIKLWTGFRHYIQQALWRDGLHLEMSSWEEVVEQAETIEIAQNVSSNYGGGLPDKRPSHGNTRPRAQFGNGSNERFRDRNGQRPRFRTDERDKTPHKKGTPSHGNEKASPAPRSNYKTDFRAKRPTPPGVDRNKQKAEGRCFNCNELGHFTRNCPKNNKVKTGGGKPPGMASFSAQIELDGDILDVPVEVLDSLPVGMIAMQMGERRPWSGTSYRGANATVPMWMDDGNYGAKPNKWLEDAYSLRATYVLTKNAPYFGDQLAKPKLDPRERFSVMYTGKKNTYLIRDGLTGNRKRLAKEKLANPLFDLAHWYETCRAKHYGKRAEAKKHKNGLMGDALAIVAERMLQSGVRACYPNVRQSGGINTRFKVSPVDDGEVYRVYDTDILEETLVPRCVLEDPTVSLVGWYMDKLVKCRNYDYWYVEELLCVTDAIKEAKGAGLPSMGETPAGIPNEGENDIPIGWTTVQDSEDESSLSEAMDEWSEIGKELVDLVSNQNDEIPKEVWDGDYGPNVAYHIHEESDPDKHLRILEVLTWNQPYPGDPGYRAQ